MFRPNVLLVCGCLTSLSLRPASGEKTRAKGAVQVGKKWWSLGPFASGKVEYDGDPLEAHGGALSLFEQGPGAAAEGGTKRAAREWGSFLAEHALGGKVTWKPAQVDVDTEGYTQVQLQHSHVPFQSLIGQPPLGGSSDILHVQYWAFGTLKVKTPGRFAIDCQGIHTFSIARAGKNASSVGPIAGNIYRRSAALGAAPVDLSEPGRYRLFARVRGKAPLHFSCGIQRVDEPLRALVDSSNLPDVVMGRLIAGASVLDIRIKNMGSEWMDVAAEVVKDPLAHKQRIQVQGQSKSVHLPPGAATQLPLHISVEGEGIEREQAACVHFEVAVVGTLTSGASTKVRLPAQLRCRKSTQSALLTFVDADGSVGAAAVLFPRRRPLDPSTAPPVPIVISLSGVGVKPQQQADAYKMKPSPNHPGDYTFGFEDLWVLAPQRGGPHNWEDVGMRTALRAIDVLASAAVAPRADARRLVVHGHSRGGHGAWGLATRIPDRVLGVASACGWYSREEYGDANNLWVHETSLMHMDKALLGLLHASVAENENSLHASNLQGSRALVRVGSQDKSVPPWFGRRMARHMQEEGVNLTFEEFDQQHWWWDSKRTNDGGVMHDEAMREWTLAAVEAGPLTLSAALKRGEISLVASSPEYVGRFGLRVLQRSSPSYRAFIHVRNSSEGLQLRTENVLRFAVEVGSEAAIAMAGVAFVDGLRVELDAAGDGELCRGQSAEEVCAASSFGGGLWKPCHGAAARPPGLLGPMRRAFAAPWLVVVPDEPSNLEVRLAAYFVTGHLTAYDTTTQAMPYSRAAMLRSTHRFVWLGMPHRFPLGSTEPWPVQVRTRGEGASREAAVLAEQQGTVLSIGPCTFGVGHGAAFLAPSRSDSGSTGNLLDLVITATDPQALEDLVTFSFATNQEHTRAPFSNMLPDFFVTGPAFRWRGYGGVAAAGYWDAEWRASTGSSYFRC